jgi:hypothetical protein
MNAGLPPAHKIHLSAALEMQCVLPLRVVSLSDCIALPRIWLAVE